VFIPNFVEPNWVLHSTRRLVYFFAETVFSQFNSIEDCKFLFQLVWFESLSNPLMAVIDVREVSKAVHKIRPDIIVAVDNSFVTPYFQVIV